MTRRLACPSCGEEEELTGQPGPDGIQVSCDRCGASWPRDAAPATCATCGGSELEQRPQPKTAYSRGTQVSIVRWQTVLLCARCDAEMLSRSLAGKLIPNDYRPAATTRRKPGDDTAAGTGSILPR